MPSTDTKQPNAVLVGGPHDGTELYVDGLPTMLEDPTLPTPRFRRQREPEPDSRTWDSHVYRLDPDCVRPDGELVGARKRYRWVRPAVATV